MRLTGAIAAAISLLFLTVALATASGQSENGAVAGSVYFDDGTPASSARLVLVPGGLNTTARQDGSFSLSAPPGTYTLRASAANTSSELAVEIQPGRTTAAVMVIERGAHPAVSFDWVPFAFLGVAMVAVMMGGFYVSRRMAETGLDLNKSIVGGAPARKPFRRRKRPKQRE